MRRWLRREPRAQPAEVALPEAGFESSRKAGQSSYQSPLDPAVSGPEREQAANIAHLPDSGQ